MSEHTIHGQAERKFVPPQVLIPDGYLYSPLLHWQPQGIYRHFCVFDVYNTSFLRLPPETSKLKNLRHLVAPYSEPLQHISKLTSLQVLKHISCDQWKENRKTASIRPFPKFHHDDGPLELKTHEASAYPGNAAKPKESRSNTNALPSIKGLGIQDCPKLKEIPQLMKNVATLELLKATHLEVGAYQELTRVA
ncbi:hypothetical protein HAX54_050706 [Datura stramonium]|uniref:Uncharacterized protein n=1 Tax=Datura stramonium TaxID=4076 RepID=A0ABS8WQK5_DATST|nr:hypothetical protein [Datura stramonium]